MESMECRQTDRQTAREKDFVKSPNGDGKPICRSADRETDRQIETNGQRDRNRETHT